MEKSLVHDTERRLCTEYQEGASTHLLAKMYGIDQKTVRNILKRHEVPRRTYSEAGRQYYADFTHFDAINTPGKAYFLGFIIAEAHIGPRASDRSAVLQIKLAIRDRNHLQKLLNEMKSSHCIHSFFEKERQFCRIGLISNKLVDELHKHGVPYTYELARFPNISPEMLNHFIRGYWDGDGTISRYKNGQWAWGVCGDRPLLVAIQEILVDKCHVSMTKIMKVPQANEAHNLMYVGNRQVSRIVEWMYRDATQQTCLSRKADRVAVMHADLQTRGVGPFRHQRRKSHFEPRL